MKPGTSLFRQFSVALSSHVVFNFLTDTFLLISCFRSANWIRTLGCSVQSSDLFTSNHWVSTICVCVCMCVCVHYRFVSFAVWTKLLSCPVNIYTVLIERMVFYRSVWFGLNRCDRNFISGVFIVRDLECNPISLSDDLFDFSDVFIHVDICLHLVSCI